VNELVTFSAQRNQILFAIVSALTAKLLVMDLKLIGAAAALALPSVSFQNLQAKSFIRLSI
jgi:hypothetical protein